MEYLTSSYFGADKRNTSAGIIHFRIYGKEVLLAYLLEGRNETLRTQTVEDLSRWFLQMDWKKCCKSPDRAAREILYELTQLLRQQSIPCENTIHGNLFVAIDSSIVLLPLSSKITIFQENFGRGMEKELLTEFTGRIQKNVGIMLRSKKEKEDEAETHYIWRLAEFSCEEQMRKALTERCTKEEAAVFLLTKNATLPVKHVEIRNVVEPTYPDTVDYLLYDNLSMQNIYSLTELHTQLGEGAFSKVFLGKNGKGQSVAVKKSENLNLLRKEAWLLQQLDGGIFPRFIGFFQEKQGCGCLVMEYVEGITLKEYVTKQGKLSQGQGVIILKQVATGILKLHEGSPKFVHCDIKPDNILLDRDGRARLIDLGCVSACGISDSIFGTRGFAAPEQLKPGRILRESVDVYGLCKTILKNTKFENPVIRDIVQAGCREDATKRIPNMHILTDLLTMVEKKNRIPKLYQMVLHNKVEFITILRLEENNRNFSSAYMKKDSGE